MRSHHHSAIKWNALFAPRTPSPLPPLAASATWKRGGEGAARLTKRSAHTETFIISFFFISLPSAFYIKFCVCVCVSGCVSAYHPSASLHCQPLWGGLICVVAVQLQNHNKISHERILGDISQMSSRLRLHTKYLGRTCARSISSTSRFLCLCCLNSVHLMLCFIHVPIPLLDNRNAKQWT